jgi:uncharacterized protein YuzE
LDLKYEVESRAFVVESDEAYIHVQAKEIEMLKDELSAEEKILIKLNINGMFAFCTCM